MDINTIIRSKVIEAIKTSTIDEIDFIEYDGINIPIFDEFPNPNVQIPLIRKAETYIIIQDQQSQDDAIQNTCSVRLNANITIRVVTRWGSIGFKDVCENIASLIDEKLRTKRNESKLSDIQSVELSISRTQSELTKANLAFSKILIYSITINI